MNNLQKFHCECGAPLKAQSGIIECTYCGNCYIWENDLQLQVKEFEQKNHSIDCTCGYYTDDNCPVHRPDYFYNPSPTMITTWNGVTLKSKPLCTCYQYKSGYCEVHNTYYGYVDLATENDIVGKNIQWRHDSENTNRINALVKNSWWDNFVKLVTNIFDRIAKGITNLWQKLT